MTDWFVVEQRESRRNPTVYIFSSSPCERIDHPCKCIFSFWRKCNGFCSNSRSCASPIVWPKGGFFFSLYSSITGNGSIQSNVYNYWIIISVVMCCANWNFSNHISHHSSLLIVNVAIQISHRHVSLQQSGFLIHSFIRRWGKKMKHGIWSMIMLIVEASSHN